MVMKSITLKPTKERAVINRHPWIFSGAINKVDKDLEPGDMVVVRDHLGTVIALGHWCGNEGLACRLFSFDKEVVPNERFWQDRFLRAKQFRASLGFPSEVTTGFRLVHGEGDGLSGLVVDIYGDSASIQSANPGLAPIMPLLSKFLIKQCGQKNVFYDDSFLKDSRWLIGEEHVTQFLEHGLRFQADIGSGQKTGHFLDQRDNRIMVQSYARKRDVLDAFCYSGGFSVHALAGGARTVASLDISKSALELAKKNVLQNGFADHRTILADCFEFLRGMKKDEYDLIILDPPAFAKTSHAVMRASRGYKDINLFAMKSIRSGGLLFTFSCSQHVDHDLFKKIIFAAAKDSQRDVRIIKELTQGPDHPVSIYCPQSNYLKGLALYVL